MKNNSAVNYIALSIVASMALIGCNSNDATNSEQQEPLEFGAALSSDFVAIRIEAENYNRFTEGWTLTSQDNIPTITPDPDPPHFSTASGSASVELLPDTRVTHDDKLINGENYWGNPGRGPELEYIVNIPEPGKYYVYVKAYSTGGEDNGIHVGIDGTMPESGKRIQLCSGKNRWTWSSAQRQSTNHCGVTKTIYLDVDTAGPHTITFYAREDGFELDQFLLLKDLREGITNCYPQLNDKIRCDDIASDEKLGTFVLETTPTIDGNDVTLEPPMVTSIVDLQLEITASKETATVAEQINYEIKIDNIDDKDTATGVTATATLPDGLDFVSSSNCVANGSQLSCDFSEIPAGSQMTAAFTATPSVAGNLRVDAQVSAEQTETTLGNNAAAASIGVKEAVPAYDGALSIIQGPNALGLGSFTTHLVSVRNIGQQPISGAQLNITAGTAVTVSTELPSCAGDAQLTCSLELIQSGDSLSVPLKIAGIEPGQDNMAVELIVSGDEDTSNNTLSTDVLVTGDAVVTDQNGIITIEAESYNTQNTPYETPLQGAFNSAWYTVSDSLTPGVSPDFDSTAAQSASNASYVEFLPDTRVGSADPIVLNVSNYPVAGESSVLEYQAFFAVAGTYYVSALIRSNNDQDSDIHVGLNDQWDTSGGLTVCQPDGEWKWTNQQDCSSGTTSHLEITTPGIHTVSVSAKTDGVEVDKLSLALDNETLPTITDAEPTLYNPVDLDLAITGSIESDTYTVTVQNLDDSDSATNVKVELTGLTEGSVSTISGFNGCTDGDESIECQIDFIEAGAQVSASVAVDGDTTDITATIIFANDTLSSNNKAETSATDGGGLIDLLFLAIMLILLYSTASLTRRTKNY